MATHEWGAGRRPNADSRQRLPSLATKWLSRWFAAESTGVGTILPATTSAVASNDLLQTITLTERVMQSTVADGSAATDRESRVEIDRDDELDRMRYVCPNGHTRWVPTNSHCYCHSCSQLADAGRGPEYYELLDKKTDETIAWSRVVLQ